MRRGKIINPINARSQRPGFSRVPGSSNGLTMGRHAGNVGMMEASREKPMRHADPNPTSMARRDAASKAGFEARERGEGDSGFTSYESQTEKNAWLMGWHDSMMQFHKRRMSHFGDAMMAEARRESDLFNEGEWAFKDGKTRKEALGDTAILADKNLIAAGWDHQAARSKSK